MRIVLLALACLSLSAAEFFVHPAGSDTNSGTGPLPAQAFATLERARDVVRALPDRSDAVVSLCGGTHRRTMPLLLDERDSGTNGRPVVWRTRPGETAIIDGGVDLGVPTVTTFQGRTAWRYAAPAAQVPDGTSSFWLGGRRMPRCTSPSFTIADWQRDGSGTYTGIVIDGRTLPQVLAMPGWTGSRVEVVTRGLWRCFRSPVTTCTDLGNGLVAFSLPGNNARDFGQGPVDNTSATQPWRMENHPALLDQPGEWWHDRVGGVLWYLPRPDDTTTMSAVLPGSAGLLRLGATDSAARLADLSITGLTFQHGAWPSVGTDGWIAIEGSLVQKPWDSEIAWPQVRLTRAERIRFAGNRIVACEGSGLYLRTDLADITVEGNRVDDTGAQAIAVGLPNSTGEILPLRTMIRDNRLTRPGQQVDTAAIDVIYADDLTLEHNEIENTPYSGMMINKRFGSFLPAGGGPYTVTGNLIRDCMGFLDDGGGIYAWMPAKPSTMSGNVVDGHHRTTGAYYFDNNCAGWTATGNVSVRARVRWLYLQTMTSSEATGNTVTGNWTDLANMEGPNASFGNVTTPNTLLTPGAALPTGAPAVVDAAGVRAPWRDLRTDLPVRPSAVTVSAGPDTTVSEDAAVWLRGEVRCDGVRLDAPRFAGPRVDLIWSQVSGPGDACFLGQQERLLQLPASFSTPGVYVLRLSAWRDRAVIVSDEVTVTVTAVPLTEVAHGRPATADSGSSSAIAKGNDGDPGSYWNQTSYAPPCWWQVDLGGPTLIARVRLLDRPGYADYEADRSNFSMFAANAPAGPFTLIGCQGANAFPDGSSFVLAPDQRGPWRYVRYQTDYWYGALVPEMQVHTYAGTPPTAMTALSGEVLSAVPGATVMAIVNQSGTSGRVLVRPVLNQTWATVDGTWGGWLALIAGEAISIRLADNAPVGGQVVVGLGPSALGTTPGTSTTMVTVSAPPSTPPVGNPDSPGDDGSSATPTPPPATAVPPAPGSTGSPLLQPSSSNSACGFGGLGLFSTTFLVVMVRRQRHQSRKRIAC